MYTAVIELPYNISDVMGDGALIIDDEVVLDNLLDSQVQFLSTALTFGHSKESWFEVEGICVSKGGHLSSAPSAYQWHPQEKEEHQTGGPHQYDPLQLFSGSTPDPSGQKTPGLCFFYDICIF